MSITPVGIAFSGSTSMVQSFAITTPITSRYDLPDSLERMLREEGPKETFRD